MTLNTTVSSVQELRAAVVTAPAQPSLWARYCIDELLRSAAVELRIAIGIEEIDDATAHTEAAWYRHLVRNKTTVLQTSGRNAPLGSEWQSIATRGEVSEALRPHHLDFVLTLGLGRETKRWLAREAAVQVWSYDFDQPNMLLNQFAEQAPHVSCQLIAVGPDGPCPRVLHRGQLRKRATLKQTITHVIETTAYWPARTAAETAHTTLSPGAIERPLPILRRASGDSPTSMWRLTRLQAWRQIKAAAGRAFLLDVWNVGFIRNTVEIPNEQNPSASIGWLNPLPSAAFIADPFPIQPSGKTVLVEYFDYRRGCRGRISAFDVPRNGASISIRDVITGPVHMSYPQTVEHNGKIYCLPETFEDSRVSIYELMTDGTWKYVTSILEGFRIVDPTILRHNSLWWLFCTIENDNDDTKLFCFYAEDLFGNWHAHRLNPLKCDVRSARPAGAIIRVDGRLVRPAQDAAEHYGGAISLCEISELTPTTFQEKVTGRLAPDRAGPYPDGLHTLNKFGDGYVVDGLRRAFHPLAFIFKAKVKHAAIKRHRPRAGCDVRPATI